MSATVHWQIGSGYETGCIAGQECNRGGQLCCIAWPSQSVGGLGVLQEFCVRLRVHAASFVQIGDRDARIDGVATHLLGGQFQGNAARELIDGRLGDVVGQDVGERSNAIDAGHVDNVAFGRNQMRNCQHRQMVDRSDVCVHHTIELLKTGVLDRSCLENSGIVHQDIQFA